MQALVQVQRHTVFSIFDSLVALHRDGEMSSFLHHFLKRSLGIDSAKEHG
jgi:hypothetical protein